MSRNIPTSTHWVTFPTNPRNAVLVEWTDGGARSATYYVTKCYWGNLSPSAHAQWGVKPSHAVKPNDEAQIVVLQGAIKKATEDAEAGKKGKKKEDQNKKSKPSVLDFMKRMKLQNVLLDNKDPTARPVPPVSKEPIVDIKGEARLFIAAEFVEEQFCGGLLSDHHIKELSGYSPPSADNGWIPEGDPWITMQLTECFQYGQSGNANNLRRFLVYHPSIAKGLQSPRIFQHRFTGLASAEIAKAGAEELPASAPAEFKAAAAAGGKLVAIGTEMMKSAVGHYLHPFLDGYGRALADFVYRQMCRAEAKSGEQTNAPLIALQLMETLLASKMNEEAEVEGKARLKSELEYAKRMHAVFKKESWLDRTLNFFKKDSSTDTGEAIAQAIINDLRSGHLSPGDEDDQVMEAMLNDIEEEGIQTLPKMLRFPNADRETIKDIQRQQLEEIPKEPQADKPYQTTEMKKSDVFKTTNAQVSVNTGAEYQGQRNPASNPNYLNNLGQGSPKSAYHRNN